MANAPPATESGTSKDIRDIQGALAVLGPLWKKQPTALVNQMSRVPVRSRLENKDEPGGRT